MATERATEGRLEGYATRARVVCAGSCNCGTARISRAGRRAETENRGAAAATDPVNRAGQEEKDESIFNSFAYEYVWRPSR